MVSYLLDCENPASGRKAGGEGPGLSCPITSRFSQTDSCKPPVLSLTN